MQPIEEAGRCFDQMAIVEKYERVIDYLYPIGQSVPNRHGVVKDMFLRCLLGQPCLFYQAGKSNQVSKIYAADAGLSNLRYWMRTLFKIKALTLHQLETAQVLVAEVGGMVNAWIKRRNKQG